MKKVVGGLLLLCASLSCAQSRLEDGGREIQLWTGGGHSVSGGTSDTGVWNVGLRYGWILTRPHGPGFLKGRFEYALDAVPLFLVFQPANTAFGAGFNPLNLKWNFATRGRVVPYLELSGGTLFTNHDVPTGTDRVNFTSSVALGTHFLGDSRNWNVELRYMHISNAGLGDRNSGINTVQVRLGIGKFFGKRSEHTLNHRTALSLAAALLCLPVCAQAPPADWIAASNKYTNQLLPVEMKHTPELGSN